MNEWLNWNIHNKRVKAYSMHLHLDHKVNQSPVEGQGPHILDDSEATYKDILMLLPAPILQQLCRRIKTFQDSI